MHVRAILQAKGNAVVTTRPEATIAETSRLLVERRIGAVIVLDGAGTIVGVLSERDIVAGIAAHGARVTAMSVAELMTRDVVLCLPDATVEEVMAMMTNRRIRHLPVVEQGKLLGIVSIGDAVKSRLDEAALEVDSLRQYVLGR